PLEPGAVAVFSLSVEYALRAMAYLASLGGEAANSERIATGTGVPPGYLSKIMRDLVVAELVQSFRGPTGGFSLARTPSCITLLDVVNAVMPMKRVRQYPAGSPGAQLGELQRRLDNALAGIEQAFGETTLAQVAGRRTNGDAAA